MESPGDHQMNDDPQIIAHSNGDAFTDPPEFTHRLSLSFGDRRLRSA
jgi:hypothetical protein